MGVGAGSQWCARLRSLDPLKKAGKSSIDFNRLGSGSGFTLAGPHPIKVQIGNLYSESVQYFRFTPAHSQSSILGTGMTSHSVSNPASNRSISTTLV